jgi:spore maturation protein CgeB
MKSVLHLRIEAPTYSSAGIERGFRQNGFEYYGFDWQAARFNYGTEAMREMVINEAKKLSPDLVFVHIQNSDALDLDTYIALQKIAPTAQFTFDVRDRERMKWAYNVAQEIHYSFFACQEDVDNCRELGIENAGLMQSSCDFDIYKPLKLPTNPYVPAEIAFIGNNFFQSNLSFDNAQERVDMVDFLKKEYGSKFKVWGLNWPDSKVASQNEEVYIYNTAKIVICQNNYSRNEYQSDRIWRALGCGVMVLAKSDPGISEIFSIENHLDVWVDFDDLKKKIDYYLYDEAERKTIAECGMKFVMENCSWTNRIAQIKSIIEKQPDLWRTRLKTLE